MFIDSNQEDTEALIASSKLKKSVLLGILSSQKALILVILSVISFGITSYLFIRLIQMDLVIDMGESGIFSLSRYNVIFYFAIILNALPPLFYIGVYTNARKVDTYGTSKWFHYASVYMKINFVLLIIAGILGLISMVGVLFVLPGAGIFGMLIIGGAVALGLWVTRMIMNFLTSIADNLKYEKIVINADPSKVIVLAWIALVLSAISLFTSAFSPSQTSPVFPEEFVGLMNQITLFSGIIGVLAIIMPLLILNQIKKDYTYQ